MMDSQKKLYKVVAVHKSRAAEIGRWLWALQDARQRTLFELNDISPHIIDWHPRDDATSIGTILYHIADIEADYLYVEVLEQQSLPPELAALFPHPTYDDQRRLTQVSGVSLEEHLHRLDIVRGRLLEVFEEMELVEFRRIRSFPHLEVTPEWVLHCLSQHEAEHRSQIVWLRQRAELVQ